MPHDSFRFLRPWSMLLPPAGSAVVAVSGSGGRTTALLRVLETYRREPVRVLVTQTTAHPVPFVLRDQVCAPTVEAVRAMLDTTGVAWTAGDASERAGGLDPEQIDALARGAGAEVVLVEAQASAGAPLRGHAGEEPVWPRRLQLALVVGHLGTVGRPWGPRTVGGVDEIEVDPAGEPRRVTTSDVVGEVRRAVAAVPSSARPLPFLTGFGAYRDLDGMFALAQELIDLPRVPVICLAELLGDERREAAEARDRPGDPPWADEDRIYAIHPASLDAEDGAADEESA